MMYVCNVNSEVEESPLPVPSLNLLTNAARRQGFKRVNGQDVLDDSAQRPGWTPGDPGAAPVGKPDLSGSRGIVGDHYESPEEPLVLPRTTAPRNGSLGDLKGSKPRTVSDILAAQEDINADGSEASGLPAMVWPQEIFQKRKGR